MVLYSMLDSFWKKQEPLSILWKEKETWRSCLLVEEAQIFSILGEVMTSQISPLEKDVLLENQVELFLTSGKLYRKNQLLLEYKEDDVREKLENFEK